MDTKKQIKPDSSIVKNFAQGEIAAFDMLYDFYSDRVRHFISGMVKTKVDSEGLTQEVFIKLWQSRSKLKKQDSFDSFLFTIAYNITMSFLRKKASEIKYIEYIKSIQITALNPEFDKKIDLKKLSQDINVAIDKLPTRQKEVFKLKHFENLTYKQIAEKLKISVNTVENHMVKSHRFLKDKLEKNYLPVLLFIHLFF